MSSGRNEIGQELKSIDLISLLNPNSDIRKQYDIIAMENAIFKYFLDRQVKELALQNAIQESLRTQSLLTQVELKQKEENQQFRQAIENNVKQAREIQERQEAASENRVTASIPPQITAVLDAVASLNYVVQMNQQAQQSNRTITQAWQAYRSNFAKRVISSLQQGEQTVTVNGKAVTVVMPQLNEAAKQELNEIEERLQKRELGMDVIRKLDHMSEAYDNEVKIQEQKIQERREEAIKEATQKAAQKAEKEGKPIPPPPPAPAPTLEQRIKDKEEAHQEAKKMLHTDERPDMLDIITILPFMRKHLMVRQVKDDGKTVDMKLDKAFATQRGEKKTKESQPTAIEFLKDVITTLIEEKKQSKEYSNMTGKEFIRTMLGQRASNDVIIDITNKDYKTYVSELVETIKNAKHGQPNAEQKKFLIDVENNIPVLKTTPRFTKTN